MVNARSIKFVIRWASANPAVAAHPIALGSSADRMVAAVVAVGAPTVSFVPATVSVLRRMAARPTATANNAALMDVVAVVVPVCLISNALLTPNVWLQVAHPIARASNAVRMVVAEAAATARVLRPVMSVATASQRRADYAEICLMRVAAVTTTKR